MSTLTQDDRPLKLTTPLGADKLLIERFEGREAICELFDFKLTALWPTALPAVPLVFDKLIGQSVTVDMLFPSDATPTMVSTYFNGIVLSIFEGEERAANTAGEGFLRYVLQVVPTFSLLRHKTQSRIFQRMTVLKILDQVIKTEGAITDYANEVQGTFEERDYCVQYRESDFAFVCRLMEEEGIFWFFRHEDGKHTLVLANASTSHTVIPAPSTIIFGKPEGEVEDPLKRIKLLEKRQTIRAGSYTLWDHCFENVGEKYESKQKSLATVAVGTITHKLNVSNDKLELYDYPGTFAQRFDGINRDGGPQAAKLAKITPDGTRTVKLRMEQEAMMGIELQGLSGVRHFKSGGKFTIDNHFDANGDFVLTQVEHLATVSGAYSGDFGSVKLKYSNAFACIPYALPYRPEMKTPRPVVHGAQTATVVGNAGEEIFTDKYGRVKVQFPWDREQKYSPDSSCWVRVGTPWAGKQWGWIHIPRIGQEVIVDFLEGDPDQPIIVGSVYNAEQMPPYELPTNSKYSTWKSNSTLEGKGFNELRFDDTKEKEEIFIHAQKDMNERILGNRTIIIGKDDKGKAAGGLQEEVWKDVQYHYKANLIEHIEGNVQRKVGLGEAKDGGNVDIIYEKNHTAMIKGDTQVLLGPDKGTLHLTITKDHNEKIGGDLNLEITGGHKEKVTGDFGLDVTGALNVKSGGGYSLAITGDYKGTSTGAMGFAATGDAYIKGMNVVIEAATALTIKAGASFIVLNAGGVAIMGPTVKIASGGSAGAGAAPSPAAPAAPAATTEAAPLEAAPAVIPDVLLMMTGFKSSKK